MIFLSCCMTLLIVLFMVVVLVVMKLVAFSLEVAEKISDVERFLQEDDRAAFTFDEQTAIRRLLRRVEAAEQEQGLTPALMDVKTPGPKTS